jgi:hypothetical protein
MKEYSNKIEMDTLLGETISPRKSPVRIIITDPGLSRFQMGSKKEIKTQAKAGDTDRKAKPEEGEPTKVGAPEKLAEPGDATEGESQIVSHW